MRRKGEAPPARPLVNIIGAIHGTFNMASWLTPQARDVVLWSPMVNAIEMMRYGLFGDAVRPYYDVRVPIGASLVCMAIGLTLCRRIRRTLVVE